MEDIDPFKVDTEEERRRETPEILQDADQGPPPQLVPSSSAGKGQDPTDHTLPAAKQAGDPPLRLRDDPNIKDSIQIVDAQKTNEGASSSYIAYIVRSQHGDAKRRYSEFEQLRAILGKLYPVLIIPPIPPHHSMSDYAVKQSKAKEDASVIARRRRMLALFLNRLARHPILGYDRVFQRFLSPHVTWPEILHSEPVNQLPKNILRAPARNPTDPDSLALYSNLPLPSSGQLLQDPDQRFLDSEAFTAKFSNHLSASLERINRRLMKRWMDLGSDEADLGGLLNGFGLLEGNTHPDLAGAIEKTGQAIDSTYLHTSLMLQDWERQFTEPLSEYSQFSDIIKNLLKYRKNKHIQYEMTRDVLDGKRAHLDELERSETEARRLDTALDRALNRVKPIDSDGEVSSPSDSTSPPAPTQQPQDNLSSSRTSTSMSKSGSLGFLGALSHTLQTVIDVDPESSRRSNITKTRELISQLELGVKATQTDLRYASQTIQADLDRFQRQKVTDLREMTLGLAGFHLDWCKKNLEQWEAVKKDAELIDVGEDSMAI